MNVAVTRTTLAKTLDIVPTMVYGGGMIIVKGITMLPLNQRLLKFREKYGLKHGDRILSYEKFAMLLGGIVSYQTLRRWEQGDRKNPSEFLICGVEDRLEKLEQENDITYE